MSQLRRRKPTATAKPNLDQDLTSRKHLTSRINQLQQGNYMKVSVDFDVCASTGGCVQVCPEVFEVRSDGFLYILQEEPGPELHVKVTEAVDLCPTAAITFE